MTVSSSLLAPPFRHEVVMEGDEAVVVLSGELDIESAGLLERAVIGLHDAGHDRVVIDLRSVEFIDSTGLRVIIGLHKEAERQGRCISLVGGPHPVQRIFELTATAALFHWR